MLSDTYDDQPQDDASPNDNIRDAVTWQDATIFSLSLPQVYARFVHAGLNRSMRTLQRYCDQGHLHAAKYQTDTGSVWFVDPDSVETKIEEIRQVQETKERLAALESDNDVPSDNVTPRHDADRRGSTPPGNSAAVDDERDATVDDAQRQSAVDVARRPEEMAQPDIAGTERHPTSSRDTQYLTVPGAMLNALTEQLAAKDEQIKRRDDQIERLVEAHNQDRQLLGAALSVIHREDFKFELSAKEEANPEVINGNEVRPDTDQGGGNFHPRSVRPDV